MTLQIYMEEKKAVIEDFLRMFFLSLHAPSPLKEAMEYMVFSSGKRIRPILTIATYESLNKGGGIDRVLPFASAIELIHTYSLIHDDLPAIDNDDIRRGRPTCHKVFGEAVAILAGDALLTEAFRIMTDRRFIIRIEPNLVARAVFEIAKACGAEGMAGGQSLDVIYDGRGGSKGILKRIHLLKTASLIRASVVTGAILAGARSRELSLLSIYGRCIGLAFQIKDDLLDLEGKEEIVGKKLRKDAEKQTFQRHYRLEDVKKKLNELTEEAERTIDRLKMEGSILSEMARFVREREK